MPLDSAAACAVETLPHAHLVLAVAQAQQEGRAVEEVQSRLWRENSEEVAMIFAAVETLRRGLAPETGIGLSADRERQAVQEARKAVPKPRSGRGLTLEQVAGRAGVDCVTLRALLEHHGFLALKPHGRDQCRRLATDETVRQGLGHNVEPGRKRVAAVEGYGKAAPFPVFYEDRLTDLLWALDLDGVRAEAARREDRADRLRWLLDHHAYLPGAELARISGYSLRTVRTALAARTALASYKREDGEGETQRKAPGLLHWVRAGMPAGFGLHSPVMMGTGRTEADAAPPHER